MRWQGGRRSSNMEDRRGARGPKLIGADKARNIHEAGDVEEALNAASAIGDPDSCDTFAVDRL